MSISNRGVTAFLLDRFEELVSGIALVVMVACVCWGVITRYVTETPAAWAAEMAGLSFAWLVFMGSAAAFKYGGMHMSIDMLVRLLPGFPRRLLTLAVDLLVLAFLTYLVWLSVVFCIASMGDPMPILRWPRSVLYASVGLGSLCMALRYLSVLLRHWRDEELPAPPFTA
ncbi:MAG: TRAP transporter small permease [Burkholderiaceae bacterium]